MDVQKKILTLIGEKFPQLRADKISLDLPLENQGIDSLDMSDLLFALEREFGRRIATSQVSSLRTVRDVERFFESQEGISS